MSTRTSFSTSFHILCFSFIGVVILNWVDPALLLSLYAVACTSFAIAISQVKGHAGVGCLFMLFFFESICYPCIFTLGTKNLGVHTKRGSSLIVMVCTPLVSLLSMLTSHLGSRRWCLVPTRPRSTGRCHQYPSVIPCSRLRIYGHDDICLVTISKRSQILI